MTFIAGEVFGDAGRIPLALSSRSWSWSGRLARFRWSAGIQEREVVATNGSFRIVGDIRLDDRETLGAAIGVNPHRRTDLELVLLGYRRWGEACLSRLAGDFAFAIWDETAATLFCARDQFGVAPFYYRQLGKDFAFATRLSDLERPDDAPDVTRMLLFVASIEDDAEATVFGRLRRLPAGHMLRWSAGTIDIAPYWHCEPDEVAATEDFGEGFRERLISAVNDRMHGGATVGAMLSGGLDSSSIASIAAMTLGPRRHDLRTFSFAYPPGSPFDERPYIDAVLAAHSPSPHFVDMTGMRPLSGISELNDGRSDLFFAPGAAKILLLLQRASAAGVATMLDGHGGDEVASHGFGRLSELAQARRWFSLLRELVGVSRTFGASPLSLFAGYYLKHGRGGRTLNRLRRLTKRHVSGGPLSPLALLNEDQANASDLADRLSAWGDCTATARANEAALHRWSVTWPGVAKGFETLRRMADRAGVSLLFPFYDRRLVSYALAVPASEKLRRGWSRAVLRTAMTGILPEAVRLRRTKIDFRGELAAGLVREGRDRLEGLIGAGARVGDLVDLAAARALTASLFASPGSVDGANLFALWRIYTLAEWLDRRAALTNAGERLS